MPSYKDLNTSERVLLGPGPSMAHPRVLRAMAQPLVGHLDPQFLEVMNEVQELLRFVFQTENEFTLPVSATGSAGMEAALCNFIESGDEVLVAVNGYFGERLCDMAGRYGARVTRLDKPWGEVFDPVEIEDQLKKSAPKIVAMVHAETSTGALQPVEEISRIVHRYGGLFLLDCVTSLGGLPVKVDEWDIDIAYSATQKCLSCPPGLAPLTVSERARENMCRRSKPVSNWYLDLCLLDKYWGGERTYHHTAPISMIFALREGLRLIYEEGLENRFERHRKNTGMLWDGLEGLGIGLHVQEEYRLASLTTPRIPQGVDDLAVRRRLLDEYNIEIAGGFGPLAGQVWRIGLMGYSSRRENVTLLLAALGEILPKKS
ncbi:MAG: pyridoxal-phosphate-dependent aminotransferase family protein [Anaerolineales bacterium]|jgi:alanine-glyoxylate transaminase/serine-glyoxylate transaminase/serine-pyruvate transaminase